MEPILGHKIYAMFFCIIFKAYFTHDQPITSVVTAERGYNRPSRVVLEGGPVILSQFRTSKTFDVSVARTAPRGRPCGQCLLVLLVTVMNNYVHSTRCTIYIGKKCRSSY